MYLFTHPFTIMFFCTIPILSWGFYKLFNEKIIVYLLGISLILLLPVFSGYDYIINNAYAALLYISLSCTYFFRIKKKPKALSTVVKPVLILFLPVAFISFCCGIAGGTVSVQKKWDLKDYKVQYVREQGFSGGPEMRYELYKYGIICIFIKDVDSKVDTTNGDNCIIKFSHEKFNFDKCTLDANLAEHDLE